MLSWLRRRKQEGLFCHFWQPQPGQQRGRENDQRSLPHPHPHPDLCLNHTAPWWCLSPSPPWVAFLQLSQHGHLVPQPSRPACTGAPTPSASLCPHPPDLSPGTFGATTLWHKHQSFRSPPYTSAPQFLCTPVWLTPSTFCKLLPAGQQLQISSGLCKPATFSATHWPAVMPDPTRSKF